MKKVLSFILCIMSFLFFNQVKAQENIYYNKNYYGTLSKTEKEVKGNPYLEDDFGLFKIEGAKIRNDIDMLRYNHYTDQIEYMIDNVTYDLDKLPNMIITFKKGNKKYIYLENNENKGGYYQLLNQGKNTLLYKRQIVVINEYRDKVDLLDGGSEIMKYETKKPEYYFTIDNLIIQIPKKKSDFLNIFKDQKVKDYIKKDKIDPLNEIDLVKLSQYINQL